MGGGETQSSLEPRATVRLSPGDKISVKASYGRMRQYVQQVSNNYVNLPTDLWQPVPKGLKPLTSDQYALGVYGTLPYQMYASAEIWYKDMHGLLEFKPGISILEPNIPWEEKVTSGKGWAYGADISLTKEAGSFTGTVSYGLMWAWRKFTEINSGNKFPGKYDNRHKINLNISYALNRKLPFSDRGINGTRHSLTVMEKTNINVPMLRTMPRVFRLYAISKDYYNFLISMILYENAPENGLHGGLIDLGLVEQEKVFTNINGGIGFIGACSVCEVEVDIFELLANKGEK